MREILSIIKKHDIKNGLTPIKAREMIEELGPTYVKLGQIMSMRSDLIPLEYCKEFEKLRASIAPLSFSTIRSIIEEELGQPIENVLKDIEEKPIGCASIAQVHLGHLLNGETVVLKVQRPHIHEIMEADVRIMHKFPRLLKMVTENAHKNGIWVGICGELGADLTLTETFLAIGVDELSVSPRAVLPLRNAVRMTDTRESAPRLLAAIDAEYPETL